MLFGRNRVGAGLHMFATAMVAFGTLMSATWILSVNSWMQTPAGYAINDVGQFVPHDWWQIVFNPSFPFRLVHMVLAAYLTTAFVEGHYDSHPNGAPLILFGIPNAKEKRIDYAVQIPKLSSLILKHDLNAPLNGLDTIPDDQEPPVAIVFWSFRVMLPAEDDEQDAWNCQIWAERRTHTHSRDYTCAAD